VLHDVFIQLWHHADRVYMRRKRERPG
jgi:hypothetical protein